MTKLLWLLSKWRNIILSRSDVITWWTIISMHNIKNYSIKAGNIQQYTWLDNKKQL